MTLGNLASAVECMDGYTEFSVTVTSCSTDYIVCGLKYNEFKNGQMFKVLEDIDVIQWKIEDTKIIIQLDVPTIDEETIFYVGIGVKQEGKEQRNAVLTLNADELSVLNKLMLNNEDGIYAALEGGKTLKAKATIEIYIEPTLDVKDIPENNESETSDLFGDSILK